MQGFLGLETGGEDQARLLAHHITTQGEFEEVRVQSDLYGVARFVTATRNG